MSKSSGNSYSLQTFAAKWPWLLVGVFMLFGIVALSVRLLVPVIDTYVYENDEFAITVPKNLKTKEANNIVSFTTDISYGQSGAQSSDAEKMSSSIEAVRAAFGIQVSCSSRIEGKDVLAEADEDYKTGEVFESFQNLSIFKTVTVQNAPARYIEYQNNVHYVLGVLVQNDTEVCLVSAYVPKDDEVRWRPVAEQSLFSLKMK